MQLLFELTAKDVCIDTSSHVGQIKSEFLLPSFLEASKALTHSPPQTLGYERSKSSFTANSRTLMAAIKSAGDFCVSRAPVHNSSPSYFSIAATVFASKVDGKARRAVLSRAPVGGYEWL